MLVTRDRTRIEEYNNLLKAEIDLLAPLVARGRSVTQLHWGGGTPTHLSPDQIRDVAAYIHRGFHIARDAEASVEVDPRELVRDHLIALRESGFNRLSMGVQDFDPRVQEAVNRVQPETMSARVYGWARSLGFQSVNLDLIYGLPFQTVRSFEETVRRVIVYRPDRIAVFNYAHVPWLKPHQKLIQQEDLPGPEEKLRILKMTIELLSASGYVYIGMDHFALPDDELAVAQRRKTLYRNFQGYSTRSGADLYGFGMSSISHFQTVYAQNTKNLPDYAAKIGAGVPATQVGYRMTEDDVIRKFVILRLMCDLALDIPAVERRFAIRFDEYFERSIEALQPLAADGLVDISPASITVIGAGRLLLRNIAMCFDAYLEKMTVGKPVFSRTV
jgi:oxygen-independent coproporphyrinogen-3 oxidase